MHVLEKRPHLGRYPRAPLPPTPGSCPASGLPARSLILHSIEREIHDEQKGPRTRIKVPLVPGQGEPIQMTNEEIYDIVFS